MCVMLAITICIEAVKKNLIKINCAVWCKIKTQRDTDTANWRGCGWVYSSRKYIVENMHTHLQTHTLRIQRNAHICLHSQVKYNNSQQKTWMWWSCYSLLHISQWCWTADKISKHKIHISYLIIAVTWSNFICLQLFNKY